MPHSIKKNQTSFKGYSHGRSFPSSIVSQQGSDIPFIEVEAEIIHCSFGSINLCYATERDSQGEISRLWFHRRRGCTFDTPKGMVRGQLLHCSRYLCYFFSSQRQAGLLKPKYSRSRLLSARNVENISQELYHFELPRISLFYLCSF